MDVSNKTLAMFLVAAIVVSIAGTIISLNKLGQVAYTGYAPTDTGYLQLSVNSSLSITTADNNTINFGTCNPEGGVDVILSSTVPKGNSTHKTCPSYNTTQSIVVRNDGNVDASVTVQTNNVGEVHSGTFLQSIRGGISWIAYRIRNSTTNRNYSGGCYGTYPSTYANFTATGTQFTVCSNLTSNPVNNSVQMDVEILLPYDALPTGTQTATLTFTANPTA